MNTANSFSTRLPKLQQSREDHLRRRREREGPPCCRDSGGPDGRVVKLDAFEAALRFLRLHILKDQQNTQQHLKAQQMSETIKGWKTTLRKQKRKKRVQRLEDLSATSLSPDEVDQVIKCESMWDEFAKTLRDVERGLEVSTSSLNQCTVMVAMLLTFRSWQCPGAVSNATLEEYRTREQVRAGDDLMTVVRVVEHKTALAASAKIVIPPGDFSKLHAHVTVIRPSQDCDCKCPYLLCLSGGRQITDLTSRFRALSKDSGVKARAIEKATERDRARRNTQGTEPRAAKRRERRAAESEQEREARLQRIRDKDVAETEQEREA